MLLTHYTDRCNLKAIREDRVLKCALSLMELRGRLDLARTRRVDSTPIACGVVLRDQQPLDEKRLVFCDGSTLPDFVEYLNGHVFFWAGDNDRRKSFCDKYPRSKCIGLRCNLSSLRAANPDAEILFSPYNSGSTPYNPKKSPRCLNLFQPLNSRRDRPIMEIVVRGRIQLPDNTEQECEDGEWVRFFR